MEEIKNIKAIDIGLNTTENDGVAYYRLNKDFKDFLGKCLEKHDIIGFEWEENSWNFGIILKNKNEQLPKS